MCWSVIIEGTSDKVRLRPGNLRRVRPPLMGGKAVREQVRVCRILLSGSRSRAGELLMLRLQVLMTTPAAASLNQVDMLGTGRALPPSVSTLWSDSQPRQPASLVSQSAFAAGTICRPVHVSGPVSRVSLSVSAFGCTLPSPRSQCILLSSLIPVVEERATEEGAVTTEVEEPSAANTFLCAPCDDENEAMEGEDEDEDEEDEDEDEDEDEENEDEVPIADILNVDTSDENKVRSACAYRRCTRD